MGGNSEFPLMQSMWNLEEVKEQVRDEVLGCALTGLPSMTSWAKSEVKTAETTAAGRKAWCQGDHQ
jgi:hypothetical protein